MLNCTNGASICCWKAGENHGIITLIERRVGRGRGIRRERIRRGEKQEEKNRRRGMRGGKKMELTCYVDAIDVSIGELLDCILGTTGEEAVILKVEAHHCIVQEVRNLACYLSEIDGVLHLLADVA